MYVDIQTEPVVHTDYYSLQGLVNQLQFIPIRRRIEKGTYYWSCNQVNEKVMIIIKILVEKFNSILRYLPVHMWWCLWLW
jgi:hypothetical protein